MGIRVKKVLGYGLTDLKGIEDSRLREGKAREDLKKGEGE